MSLHVISQLTGARLPTRVRSRRYLGATLRLGAAAAGLVGGVSAAAAALKSQARIAATTIVEAAAADATDQGVLTADQVFAWQAAPPDGCGVYLPSGVGPLDYGPAGTAVLTLLGDSTAVGYGCHSAAETPGVVLARAAATALGRPVRVTDHGIVGTGAAALAGQAMDALGDSPDVVVILVGANDVRDRVAPRTSAGELSDVVSHLVGLGIAVVVGTCPDLGVIPAIPQPLRTLAGVSSRRLARAQYRAVTAAGGQAVNLGNLVADYRGDTELFYADRFHPSGAGYALAAAILEPAVTAAMAKAVDSAPVLSG